MRDIELIILMSSDFISSFKILTLFILGENL